MAGRREVLLCPQDDALIARRARETHTLADQHPPQPEAARLGLHQQQAQFRGAALARHQENAPQTAARRTLCDPAALARRVELADEIGSDPRHQCLELLVPAIFPEIQRAVALDHPAHVPGAVRAQRHLRLSGGSTECAADDAHRLQQRRPTRAVEARQHRANLPLRTALEGREHPPAGRGEPQVPAPCVGGRGGACKQSLRLKALEDAAEISAVEPQLARQLGSHDARAMRDLVHHPHFGQGVGTVEEALRQHADAAGVIAIEGAHLTDLFVRDRHRRHLGQSAATGRRSAACPPMPHRLVFS